MALEKHTKEQQIELPNIKYDSVLEHPKIPVPDSESAAIILGINVNSFITNVRRRYPWLLGKNEKVTLGRLELYVNMKSQGRGPYSEQQKLDQLDTSLEKILSAEDLYSSQPSLSGEGYKGAGTFPSPLPLSQGTRLLPVPSQVVKPGSPEPVTAGPPVAETLPKPEYIPKPVFSYTPMEGSEFARQLNANEIPIDAYIYHQGGGMSVGTLVKVILKEGKIEKIKVDFPGIGLVGLMVNQKSFPERWGKEKSVPKGILLPDGTIYGSNQKPVLDEIAQGALSPSDAGLPLTADLGAKLESPEPVAESLIEHPSPRSKTLEKLRIPSLYEIALQQMARGEYPFIEKNILIYHGGDSRFAKEATKGTRVLHILKLHHGMGIVEVNKEGVIDVYFADSGEHKYFEVDSKRDLNEKLWGFSPDGSLEYNAKSMLDAPIPDDLRKKINGLAGSNDKLCALLTYVQKRVPGYYSALEIAAVMYNGGACYFKDVIPSTANKGELAALEAKHLSLNALAVIGVATRSQNNTGSTINYILRGTVAMPK